MFTGALPTTSIYGTWSENIELRSADDGVLCNLDDITEITLKLLDPSTKSIELTLTMSDGDIVIPSDGIVQWNTDASALNPQIYEVVMTFEDGTDTLPLVLGSISIVD